MTGMGIALGVVLLILLTPLGVYLTIRDGRVQFAVTVWRIPFRVKVKTGKTRKPKEKKDRKKKKGREADGTEKSFAVKSLVRGTDDMRELLRLVKPLVRRVFKGLRITRLHMTLIVATGDAAKTAVRYGQINALTGLALPYLHKLIRIRNERIRYEVDFTRETCVLTLELAVSLTVGRALAMTLAAAAAFLKYYMPRRKRGKGAEQTPVPQN